jgi:hypothetical protein
VRRDRLIGGSAIIRTISRHPNNPATNLIAQRRHLGRMVGVLISQVCPPIMHLAASIA